MCGKEYEYCPNCSSGIEKPWKYLFHDEKCLTVSKIWYAYRGKEINDKEAIEQMNEYPETVANILKNDSVPAQEIKAIYGAKKQEAEKESEPVVKENAPEIKKEEVAVEEKKNDKKNFSYKNGNNKNKNQ